MMAAVMDRYVVIGNPIAHSLSPEIHALFAAETGESIEYGRLLVGRGAFDREARAFFAGGGRGANVTLPFKTDAFAFADTQSERARLAGAANFLSASGGRIHADNTDGAGLVADLTRNLAFVLAGKRVLLVGAGGAARGVVAPLLAEGLAVLVIANRTASRAQELRDRFGSRGPVEVCALDEIPRRAYDLVLNATAASTHGEPLSLPATAFGPETLAYDLAYGPGARDFMAHAQRHRARACDGLGMLVEQAAESFALWRGKRPSTAPVLARLRAGMR
jgi:shikimate dehydrogenase